LRCTFSLLSIDDGAVIGKRKLNFRKVGNAVGNGESNVDSRFIIAGTVSRPEKKTAEA